LAPRPALRATVARRPEAAEHDRPYHAALGGSSPLGLTDMKGRIYDPLAGRFTTADPVMQAPFWSQGLNRYSYVFNDPINLTDPSGFVAEGLGYFASNPSFAGDASSSLGGSVALGICRDGHPRDLCQLAR
jgi:RHS repeat-associated protein